MRRDVTDDGQTNRQQTDGRTDNIRTDGRLMLSNSLPIFDEICKRSAKFILFCLCSGSALVRTFINRGILARSDSFFGRNFMFLSSRYR